MASLAQCATWGSIRCTPEILLRPSLALSRQHSKYGITGTVCYRGRCTPEILLRPPADILPHPARVLSPSRKHVAASTSPQAPVAPLRIDETPFPNASPSVPPLSPICLQCRTQVSVIEKAQHTGDHMLIRCIFAYPPCGAKIQAHASYWTSSATGSCLRHI
jgi:hypothetical protein